MKTVKNELIVFYDVDETLILSKESSDYDDVQIVCPYSSGTLTYKEHKRHTKLLRDHKARGMFIVVWSAAGHAWAETVVKSLGLEPFVDLVMSKPRAYVDDLQASEVLGPRIYLKD